MTGGNDAQRTSWVRSDPKIAKDRLQNGFDFIWKLKLEGDARQAPLLLSRYIGYRGFRSLGFVGLPSDKVVGIDIDLGRVEWQKQLPITGSSTCAASISALTRPTNAAIASMDGGRGGGGFGGRGGPAKSGVGNAGEGAVTLQQVLAARAVAAQAGADAGRRGGGGGGFGRMPTLLQLVTRDGMLHTIYVSNGEPSQPPIRFVAANTSLKGLAVVDSVAYAAAGTSCDAAPNSIVALDLTSKEVTSFKPTAGNIAGSDALAFGPDGTVYAATTEGELVALEAKTLKPKDVYKTSEGFTSSPVVFDDKGKVMVAASTKDGRIHLLSGSSLQTPIFQSSPGNAVTSLATWQDAGGTRWLVGPTSGALVAWQMSDGHSLKAGWTSRDLAAPVAPIIINGVAFTASTGSAPVLYALDASSGKDLWNSGKKISSAMRAGSLSFGNSQVFLGANDGSLYVFGFPMEH
jgi:outer membrane protein assembly factor BamB